jgi:hypothetical protein
MTTAPLPITEPAAPATLTPLVVDVLQTCTARFDHEGWALFQAWQHNDEALRTYRIKVELFARTQQGASQLASLLDELHVPAIKQKGLMLAFITTFERLQEVIRHEATHRVVVRCVDPKAQAL